MKARASFLADENIAAPLVHAMRDDGWDVLSVSETQPGIPDKAVLAWAYREGRILLTSDRDFGELVIRMRYPVVGVLMLRMPPGRWLESWARLRTVLAIYSAKLEGSFTIVQPRNIRFRLID